MRIRFLLLALMAFTLGTVIPLNPAAAADKGAPKGLTGAWKLTERAVDAEGKPCPFVPDAIEFFPDQSMTMSNMPGQRLPFKTDLSPKEREALDARFPDFKDQPLLLVRHRPEIPWEKSPIVYVYTLSKNELTLVVRGFTPSKFTRTKK